MNAANAGRPNVVVERTYQATVEELWSLWTTKEGFESWWGPVGFRVDVHEIDPRVGGALRYDMIADAPEQIAAMKAMCQPASHKTHGTFTAVEPMKRLELTHVIDFLPGVKPYDSTMVVEFFPSGNRVRMVVTFSPMHDESTSNMQKEGFASQLTKLDRRFGT